MKNISTLSVCIIAKNEELCIEQCIESIKPVADEIIVNDTGSIDNTLEIVKSCGADIIQSEWKNDFSYSRNISIKNAKNPWILWLDADDIVPQQSLALINQLKKQKPDKVFAMVVRNQKPDGTGTEFMQARMFPNNPAIRFERPIHEQIMPSALRIGLTMHNTDIVIEHHGYADPKTMKSKAERNVKLLYACIVENSSDPYLFIEIADSYTIMEEQDKAEIWYLKVINIPQSNMKYPVIVSQAYMGLGNICNKQKNYPEAINCFNEARKLCPQRTDVLYCLAVSYDLSEEKRNAADTLYQIFDMDHAIIKVGIDYRQTEIKACLRLGRILREIATVDEMGKLAKLALERWGERAEIQNMIGIIYFQTGRLLDAIHCFEQSLKIIVQGNIDAYVGLCMIYKKAGKMDVVKQTLLGIKPFFGDNPKYMALCKVLGFWEIIPCLPDNISMEDVEGEVEGVIKGYKI